MRPPVDVILPSLDEAAALPAVLAAFPVGYRLHLHDTDTVRGTVRAAADISRILTVVGAEHRSAPAPR